MISVIAVWNADLSDVVREIYTDANLLSTIPVRLKHYRGSRDVVNESVVSHHDPSVIEEVHKLQTDGEPVGLREAHGARGVNYVGHVLDDAV